MKRFNILNGVKVDQQIGFLTIFKKKPDDDVMMMMKWMRSLTKKIPMIAKASLVFAKAIC